MTQPTPTPLYTPDRRTTEQSLLKQYMNWLFVKKGLYFRDYDDLWDWSVTDLEEFWASIWQFFDVQSDTPYYQVVQKPAQGGMIGTEWFAGATLNYAEYVFRHRNPDRPAILYTSEWSDTRWSGRETAGANQRQHPLMTLSWSELERQVAAVVAYLRRQGVVAGDRVVAVLPNCPEAVVALLATTAVGAVWSVCAPTVGSTGLISHFQQLEPKILFATDGYAYNGILTDVSEAIRTLCTDLPTLQRVVWVPHGDANSLLERGEQWRDVLDIPTPGELTFESVPFNHPIWVLYSSATAGKPKAITHSVGGCLLEHLKMLTLHQDVRVGDTCFYQSTPGSALWHVALGSLLVGATLVLYDGAADYPDPDVLWRLVDEARINHFGAETAYFLTCIKAGLRPMDRHKLTHLRTISSTGPLLPPEGFRWVYESVKKNGWLISSAVSPDLCSTAVGGNPLLPVYAAESQCRLLGCKVDVFSQEGLPLRGLPGEVVIREPMPSMPRYYWDDRRAHLTGAQQARNESYRRSYFAPYPGVWHCGEYGRLTEHNGLVLYGRSDATLCRDGVRIGTDEVYCVVEQLPDIADSLIVGLEQPGGRYFMPLFVVLNSGFVLTDDLIERINDCLRSRLGTIYVPDAVYPVNEIPYTFGGEKLETSVRKILSGMDASLAVDQAMVRNPAALSQFAEFSIER